VQQFLRRNRSVFIRDSGLHGINISANIHRLSQRNSFIEQAIDPCLLNSRSMFLLFAFDLQFAIARILFQRCLAPYAPLKFVDTAFAAIDLGAGHHLNGHLLNESLKPAPFPVLPGRPLPAVVSGADGEA